MAEKEIIVFIYLPGMVDAVPAGIFSHDSDSEIGTFIYGQRYLERDNAIAVDPIALPLGVEPSPVITNSGVYGSFRDASPDYWGRLVIAAELKTAPESLSEIDFLMHSNATRVGNLDFRESPESPEPDLSPPAFNQLSTIIHAAENIEDGKESEPYLIDLLCQGSSMGGARPKCTVEWNNSLWLAKFSSKGDTVNIPRIEYAAMKLAEECGINVPDLDVCSVAGKDVYLIKRFDREKSTDGWLRNGFISSLSLMQLDERDRLDWSYPLIAATMRKYCSITDVIQLYRRMIYNIFIRNTDDHPRNHGIMIAGKKLKLSPAYDIVPSFIQLGVSTDFNLAMSVGKRGREASIDNALSACEQFGLTHNKAQAVIDEMFDVINNWQELFAKYGVSQQEIELLKPSIKTW
jgi:serine/threonine-protein kinase HipA